MVASLTVVSLGCTADSDLRPFTSDGCSLFPDSSIISGEDWCSCCFDHDLQYWRGGTRDEREAADRKLQQCVLEKTGNATLANAMYQGVNLGGSPYFYNWYRWGYGWGFERKYEALTPDEVEVADMLVADYFTGSDEPVCRD